jgi:RNA-directed DNA polymerase
MKNKIFFNYYYFPSQLEEKLHRFVSHYNHERYHESIANLTPVDVYYGRGEALLALREKLNNIIALRRKSHYDQTTC